MIYPMCLTLQRTRTWLSLQTYVVRLWVNLKGTIGDLSSQFWFLQAIKVRKKFHLNAIFLNKSLLYRSVSTGLTVKRERKIK